MRPHLGEGHFEDLAEGLRTIYELVFALMRVVVRRPDPSPPDDAGEAEWKRVGSSEGEVAYGTWRYGTEGPSTGGWDLKKIGGPEPPDTAPRFDDQGQFCAHP